MFTVSLVEDDDRDRELFSSYISGAKGLRLVSVYATAEEAVKRFPSEKPDVAFLDIKFPGMDGIECIRRLRQIVPMLSTHFIILTGHEDSNLIFDSLRAGAHGFLLKDKTVRESLLSAIEEVTAGGGPMSPCVARHVMTYFAGEAKPTNPLTDKECDVMRDLAGGLSYKEIAAKLSISLNTVRQRIKGIYEKLHVHSRKEAVKVAQELPSLSGDGAKT